MIRAGHRPKETRMKRTSILASLAAFLALPALAAPPKELGKPEGRVNTITLMLM
jgi:hypothetical protein